MELHQSITLYLPKNIGKIKSENFKKNAGMKIKNSPMIYLLLKKQII